jgi:hypothetical protein
MHATRQQCWDGAQLLRSWFYVLYIWISYCSRLGTYDEPCACCVLTALNYVANTSCISRFSWRAAVPVQDCVQLQLEDLTTHLRTRSYKTVFFKLLVLTYSSRLSRAEVNLLTPELNPSAQRCLTRFFTGDFASWTVHFVNICVKNQQIHRLFIQFINYVW